MALQPDIYGDYGAMPMQDDLFPKASVEPWDWVPEEWGAAQQADVIPVPEFAPAGASSETLAPDMQRDELLPPLPVRAPVARAPMQPGLGGMPTSTLDALPPLPPDPGVAPDFGGDYTATPRDLSYSAVDDDKDVGELATDFANLPFEQQVLIKGKHDAARADEMATAHATAAKSNRERMESNERIFHESRAAAMQERQAVEADAKKMATEKIDPDGWKDSRTTFQMMAAIGGAIAGGFLSLKHGGPNVGMQMIQKQIDEHIAAQRENLAARRADIGRRSGLANEHLADAQATYRMEAAFTASAWEQTIGDLQSQAQQYDPRGTQAIRIGTVITEARARQAAGLMKFQEEAQKRADAAAKLKLDQDKAAEDKRNNIAQTATANWNASTTAKAQKETEAKNARDLKLDERRIAADEAKAKVAAGAEERTATRERGIGGQATLATDKDGKLGVTYGSMKNRDGSNFVPQGSVASADKLRNATAATDTMVGLMDEMIRRGPEWLSDTANSNKLQEMKVAFNAIRLEGKDAFELGVIAGPDLDLIDGFFGTSDPTRRKDSIAGMKQSRKIMAQRLTKRLQRAGFDGEYDPPDLSTLGEAATEVGDEEFKKALGTKPSLTHFIEATGAENSVKRMDEAGGTEGWVIPATQNMITSLVHIVKDSSSKVSDKQRSDARAQLESLMDHGPNEGTRTAARNALLSGAGNEPFEIPTSTQVTAKETR